MELTNTILHSLTRRNIDTFRHCVNIHIVHNRNRKRDYTLRLNNGSIIGEIKKSNDNYQISFFNNYNNRMRFSQKTNNTIDKVKTISQDVKSGKIRNIKNFEPPKYYTTPKRIRTHKTTRIFQPIDLIKGEYWEITNKEIGGRIITGYRKVNIYSGESDKWQYKAAA